MKIEERKTVIINEEQVADYIEDGMTIAVGGFINSLHPMTIIRQIVRRGLKDFTLVGSGSAGLEVDLLVGAGCVKKLISPYVGAEDLAPIGPMYRAMAQSGKLEVWECDEGQYYTGLRAAAKLLPFGPCRAGLGTSYPAINKDLKEFADPISGEKLLAVPAISPDIAILHAAYSDAYGNVQHEGSSFSDIALFQAADKTIVEVEKIVPNEYIRQNPYKTTIHSAHAIVRSSFWVSSIRQPRFLHRRRGAY